MDYQNKVVLVTGGANGIGKAISEAFLAAGATTVVADLDEKNGAALVEAWRQKGGQAIFYNIDLTDAAAIGALFRFIIQTCGKLDILINNAGKSNFKPICELTIAEWDEIIQLNLRAAFVTAQEFAKCQQDGAYGRIINIASTRYLMSEPHSEAYAASKGGIVALTHALALSLSAENFTVNAISPGWIQNQHYEQLSASDHEQHPAKRVGRPEDVARACLFLADPQNDFITGENLVVDGGMTKKMIYS